MDLELSAGKAACKTMGYAEVPLASPKKFLKSRTGGMKTGVVAKKRTFVATKPAVPRRNERPVYGLKSDKNFVTANAIENIMAVPAKPEPAYVDAVSGKSGRFPLDPSGLVPNYVYKKDFGKVPAYLRRRRQDERRAHAAETARLQELQENGAYKQVSEAERQALLGGLKANWERLHREYLGLSVITDTGPKKARKKAMEDKLAGLEESIQRLEAHPVIFVAR